MALWTPARPGVPQASAMTSSARNPATKTSSERSWLLVARGASSACERRGRGAFQLRHGGRSCTGARGFTRARQHCARALIRSSRALSPWLRLPWVEETGGRRGEPNAPPQCPRHRAMYPRSQQRLEELGFLRKGVAQREDGLATADLHRGLVRVCSHGGGDGVEDARARERLQRPPRRRKSKERRFVD